MRGITFNSKWILCNGFNAMHCAIATAAAAAAAVTGIVCQLLHFHLLQSLNANHFSNNRPMGRNSSRKMRLY